MGVVVPPFAQHGSCSPSLLQEDWLKRQWVEPAYVWQKEQILLQNREEGPKESLPSPLPSYTEGMMGRGSPFSSTPGPRVPPALIPTFQLPRPKAPNFSLPLFTSGEAGRFTPWPCSGLDSLVALIFPTADHRPANGRFPALPLLLLLLPPTLPLPSRLLASFCTAQAREKEGGGKTQFGGAGQPRALGSCSSLAKTRGNVRGGTSRKGRNSNSRKPLWHGAGEVFLRRSSRSSGHLWLVIKELGGEEI